MLVTPALCYNEVHMNSGEGVIHLAKGDKVQLYGPTLTRMLQEGLVVKAEYDGFLNNEIVVVEYNEKDANWRPVGTRISR